MLQLCGDKLRAFILSLLLCVAAVAQDPRTSSIGLFVPTHGTPLWSGDLDGNFGTIDQVVGQSHRGNLNSVGTITFTTGGFLEDDVLFGDPPGGLDFASVGDTNDMPFVQHDSTIPTGPDNYDWVGIESGFNPGAVAWVWDEELGFGHNGFGCPGSSDRLNGGASIYSILPDGSDAAANFCGDTTGEWWLGTVTVFGPVILAPTTYSQVQGWCNGTSNAVSGVFSQGSYATITDSTTNSNGSAISGGGTYHVAAYCDTSTWRVMGGTLGTLSNCAAVGTGANPSVVSCSGASGGSVACATAASGGTCKVNTTTVTTASEIIIRQRTDSATGTRLGVTCNGTKDSNSTAPQITAVTAGTSFTFQLGTISSNPECFSYYVVN